MRILRFGHFYGLWRTEIPDEPVQRIIALQVLAVVIARDSKDRSVIEFVRLIELLIILRRFAVEINTITGNIKKRGVFACILLVVEILLHAVGDKLLGHRVLNAAHIAVQMKSELLPAHDRLIVPGRDDVPQIEVEGRSPSGWRQRPEMRVAFGLDMDRVLPASRRPGPTEHVRLAPLCYRHLTLPFDLRRL